jgi:hypothetical protein
MMINGMKITNTVRFVSAAVSLVAAHTATADVFLRGTHNNWEAEPMLGQGYYNASDILTFKDCDKVAFKFDTRGDWSINYGDYDNVRGYNPGINAMEGHLDQGGSNIEVECGKTYFIEMNHYGAGSGSTYSLRDLAVDVPQTLGTDTNAAFRKAIRGGGFYGSVSITGELLVRDLPGETKIVVRAIDSEGRTIVGEASPYKTLSDGLSLWRFAVGSYGSINLQSIELENNGLSNPVEIDKALIQ